MMMTTMMMIRMMMARVTIRMMVVMVATFLRYQCCLIRDDDDDREDDDKDVGYGDKDDDCDANYHRSIPCITNAASQELPARLTLADKGLADCYCSHPDAA